MKNINGRDWIPVRKSNLKYYDDINLYYLPKKSQNVLLYKAAGLKFTEQYLADNPFAGSLYIQPEDKEKCLREAQRGFSMELTHDILNEGAGKVKAGLVNIVGESLSDPRAGGLGVMEQTVEVVVDGYANQPEIIKNLARISHSDYTTTIHSINVMALTVGYCFYTQKDIGTTVRYGLAALFHDIGKTEIPIEILSAPRKLTDYEFQVIQSHPQLGAEILQANDSSVHTAIPGALEHHEKVDGSGYPVNLKTISEIGQILAVVDSYEALTNDDRLYRSALEPIDALEILKKEVTSRRLNPDIFVDFAYSLTDFTKESGKDRYRKIFQGWDETRYAV
jgi:HD-GYP domain-containing protein (c-di-GMP phosphodiesterase class II)